MNPNIAVVHDDPDLHRILRHHLSQWGYEVHSATNHRELQHLLARVKIDLVLLDLTLVNEKGLDILSDLVRSASPVRSSS